MKGQHASVDVGKSAGKISCCSPGMLALSCLARSRAATTCGSTSTLYADDTEEPADALGAGAAVTAAVVACTGAGTAVTASVASCAAAVAAGSDAVAGRPPKVSFFFLDFVSGLACIDNIGRKI